jgi:hypothetical protein
MVEGKGESNTCSGRQQPAHHLRSIADMHDSCGNCYPLAFKIRENPCKSLRQRGKTTVLIISGTDCSLT